MTGTARLLAVALCLTYAPAAAGDAVFNKLTPGLRMRLGAKTAEPIHAIARLARAVPAPALDELRAAGLTVHSADAVALHVSGDAEALLRLAARDEVLRLTISAPLRR